MLIRIAQTMEGKADVTKIEDIKLEELAKEFRRQRVIFETAVEVYEQVQPTWAGRKELLLIQLIRIVESFLDSDKLVIKSRHYQEEDRRRLLIILNMGRIVNHIFRAIRFENTSSLAPVFNTVEKTGSTGNMMTWRTSRPCEPTEKSHISHVAVDSTWEASEAFELERNDNVLSWVKNDHLGFVIHYTFNGSIHKYFPDFIIRLKNGRMLILEVKGIDDARNKAKRDSLAEWVRAVNEYGGYGTWAWDVSFRTSDIKDILAKHAEKE
jgi:type III restriction enzyme